MYPNPPTKKWTTSIADGGTKSDPVDLEHYKAFVFLTDAKLDGTTLTFEAAPVEGGTYVAARDGAGNAVSMTVSASKAIVPGDAAAYFLAAARWVKLVSGSTESDGSDFTILGIY